MSGIEELQQRVAAVEQRFGLANEQRTKYSARLLGMMDAIEARMREQQAEVARQADELGQRAAELAELTARAERGGHENEQLRGMLHSLLQAIEAGSRDVLCETMQALDAKVSSLIADTAQAAAGSEPAPEAADSEPAVADEAVPDIADADPEPVAHESAAGEVGADEPMVIVRDDEASEMPGEISGEPVEVTANESVTLAAIMQRVSKLIDDDEAPDPGAGTAGEPDAAAQAEPAPDGGDAERADETGSEPTQAAANS